MPSSGAAPSHPTPASQHPVTTIASQHLPNRSSVTVNGTTSTTRTTVPQSSASNGGSLRRPRGTGRRGGSVAMGVRKKPGASHVSGAIPTASGGVAPTHGSGPPSSVGNVDTATAGAKSTPDSQQRRDNIDEQVEEMVRKIKSNTFKEICATIILLYPCNYTHENLSLPSSG